MQIDIKPIQNLTGIVEVPTLESSFDGMITDLGGNTFERIELLPNGTNALFVVYYLGNSTRGENTVIDFVKDKPIFYIPLILDHSSQDNDVKVLQSATAISKIIKFFKPFSKDKKYGIVQRWRINGTVKLTQDIILPSTKPLTELITQAYRYKKTDCYQAMFGDGTSRTFEEILKTSKVSDS